LELQGRRHGGAHRRGERGGRRGGEEGAAARGARGEGRLLGALGLLGPWLLCSVSMLLYVRRKEEGEEKREKRKEEGKEKKKRNFFSKFGNVQKKIKYNL
jgi:hypothetical protein